MALDRAVRLPDEGEGLGRREEEDQVLRSRSLSMNRSVRRMSGV